MTFFGKGIKTNIICPFSILSYYDDVLDVWSQNPSDNTSNSEITAFFFVF